MISPYEKKIPAQDDNQIITSEKETHNFILNEEQPVKIYTPQKQNICAFQAEPLAKQGSASMIHVETDRQTD